MRSLGTNETKKIASDLAQTLLAKRSNPLVIGLVGELGAGKTFFVQSFLKRLGVKYPILSPTFVLVKEYSLKHGFYNKAYHVDLYRLSSPKDLPPLGLDRLLSRKRSIILIEWAEKARELLPGDAVWIKFEHGNEEQERFIRLTANS